MTQERTHKRFSPSQAERFTACLGSTNRLAITPPREPTEYQLDGIKAHEVLDVAIKNKLTTANDAIQETIYLFDDFEPGFKGSINTALDYVWDIVDELDLMYGDVQIFNEVEVNPPVASAPDEAGGFCDIAIYSKLGRILYVIDYKHGYVTKAVNGNAQALQYAAGFLFGENSPIKVEDVDTIVLTIIQPNAFHKDGECREWRIAPGEVFDYLMKLDGIIEASLRDDAPLTPGYQQCRFCDCRSTCPALAASNLALINPELKDVRELAQSKLPSPHTMDVQRLSYIKQSIPLLKAWMKDVEDHVSQLVKSGTAVPGYKEVQAYGAREWYGDKIEIAHKLASLCDVPVEQVYAPRLINITDADELIVETFKSRAGRGKKKQAAEEANRMLAYLVIKKDNPNTTVVSNSDPRPPVSKAYAAFGGIAGIIPPPPTQGQSI